MIRRLLSPRWAADPDLSGWADPSRARWDTVANGITALRTVAAVLIALIAWVDEAPVLIAVGYAVYWIGDMLDGYFARRLDQETRRGAVFDILADRLSTTVLGLALVACFPWTAAPVLIFLSQFIVIDLALSLLFLRWPLKSPNYFYLVDRLIYRWNWSPPAKAVNTASVVLVTALSHSALAGSVVAGAILLAKVAFLVRGVRLARLDRILPLQSPPAVITGAPA